MKITQKLLGLLHRVFDRDPHQFTALRLNYDGGMVWTIADGFLTTAVSGGSGVPLSIDLSQYTVGQLANYLGQQQGYSISYVDRSALSLLSARILIDGTNDISTSNGNLISGYTNVLWSYIDANANELEQARTQIGEMLKQMSTTTAGDEWLDNLGAMYGVPRILGELDNSYGPRIIAEVLRPRSNNVAIQAAISAYTGQATTVTDVTLYGATFPLYNGAISRNSVYTYNASNKPIYGLFDVQYGYDLLNGADVGTFKTTVAAIVDRLRAAGTQMRSLSLQGGNIGDTLTPPTDGGNLAFAAATVIVDTLTAPTDAFAAALSIAGFADTLTAPTDGEMEVTRYGYAYNAVRTRNSAINYQGGTCAISPAPAIDWNFMSGSLDPSLTFTRTTTATYFDANGILQTAAVNAPRFDHDPTTTKAIGLLMEESRTNLITYSQDFTNAIWGKGRSSIVGAAAIAPDGTMTACKLVEDTTASNTHYAIQTVSVAATTVYTYSIFVRAGERTIAEIEIGNFANQAASNAIYIDLTTGAFTATDASRTAVVALPGGWYRVSSTTTSVASGSLQGAVYASAAMGNRNYTGDGASGIYVWGGQFEAGGFATSYIPTTTAAVTRGVESLTAASIPWYNTAASTVVIDYQDMSLTAASNGTLFMFTDSTGGNTNRVAIYKDPNSNRLLRFNGGGATDVGTTDSTSYSLGRHRLAIAFGGSNYNYAHDGTVTYSSTTTAPPTNITALSIGVDGGSSQRLSAWIRRFTYVASQLDTPLLALLTT